MKRVADQLKGGRVLVGMALLAVVAALVIAGCGDSSDATGSGTTESADTAPVVTKAVLIKKGEAICAKTDDVQAKGLAAFEKKNPGAVRTTKGLEQVIVEVALPAVGTEIEELKALGSPKGKEATWSEILEGWEEALQRAESNPASVGKSLGPFKAPGEKAAKLGFKECANAL